MHVQLEQAATTAIAAKPLLAKLRYELEKLQRQQLFGDFLNGGPVLPNLGNDVNLKRLNDQPGFIPSYYLTDNDAADARYYQDVHGKNPSKNEDDRKALERGEFAFRSPQAAFVNRILAEYDDPEETDPQPDEPSKQTGATAFTPRPVSPDYRNKLYRARGRTGEGLETLVRRYIAAKRNADGEFEAAYPHQIPPRRYVPAEGILFDALAHFSEKVLFSANNSVLFNERVGFPTLLKSDSVFYWQGGADPNAVKSSYVTVLQAVGNSILVSLNELREHLQHDADLADRYIVAQELRALDASLRPDPYQVLRQVINAVSSELAANEEVSPPSPPDGRDRLAVAREDREKAILEHDSAQKKLEQAQRDVQFFQAKQTDTGKVTSPILDVIDWVIDWIRVYVLKLSRAVNPMNIGPGGQVEVAQKALDEATAAVKKAAEKKALLDVASNYCAG